MEADLAPTTSAATNQLHSTHEQHTRQLLSVPPRNGIPTCDVSIPWDTFYEDSQYDLKLWKTLSPWDRYPSFLKLYDTKHPAERQTLENAIQKTDAATKIASDIIQTQTQIKSDYNTTAANCNMILQSAIELDAAARPIDVQKSKKILDLYDEIQKHIIDTTDAYSSSINNHTRPLEDQMNAAVEEETIAKIVYELDVLRHQVFLDIVKTQTQKKPKTQINRYTVQQIKQAEDEKDEALRTSEESYKEFQKSSRKIKNTKTAKDKAESAKTAYMKSVQDTNAVMIKLAFLIPRIKKAADEAAAAEPAARDPPAPAQHTAAIVAVIHDEIEQLREIQDEADHAAAAHTQQNAAAVRTNERTVVAEKIESAATHLHDTQAASAAQDQSSSRIVALQAEELELRRDAVDAVQKQVQNADTTSGNKDLLLVTQQNLAEAQIEVAVADSALQTGHNQQNQVHIDAYKTAMSCTEQCHNAVKAAFDQAKKEVLAYADMIVASTKNNKDVAKLGVSRTRYIKLMETMDKQKELKQVSDQVYTSTKDKIITKLKDIEKKQHDVDRNREKLNLEEQAQEEIYRTSFELHETAKTNFDKAKDVLEQAWQKLPKDEQMSTRRVFTIDSKTMLSPEYVLAMVNQTMQTNFPRESLDTIDDDIDNLAAKEIEAWQLKIDKHGQNLAMLHKIESNLKAMEKLQECVPKAQALRTSLQTEIEAYCQCTIEIETMRKEQPKGQTAQTDHARSLAAKEIEASALNDSMTKMHDTLVHETESANAAIEEVLRFTTDEEEVKELQTQTILPLDTRTTIEQRLSALRAQQNIAAVAAAKDKARQEHDAKIKEDAWREKLQTEYDIANEKTRTAIDTYLDSHKALKVECEKHASLGMHLDFKQWKLKEKKQLLTALQRNETDVITPAITALQEQIEKFTVQIQEEETHLENAIKVAQALVDKNKLERKEALEQAASSSSDRYKHSFLTQEPEFYTAEIIPLFDWKKEYDNYIKNMLAERRRKYDENVAKTKEDVNALVGIYNKSLDTLQISMRATIKINLRLEKRKTSTTKSIGETQASIEDELSRATTEEDTNLETFRKAREEVIHKTRKALRIVFATEHRKTYLDNLQLFARRTTSDIRQTIVIQERKSAHQPDPALITDATHTPNAPNAAVSPPVTADSRAETYHTNKMAAIALYATITANNKQLQTNLNALVAAYRVVVSTQRTDSAALLNALETYKASYKTLHEITETHNANVMLYIQTAQIVADNAPSTQDKELWLNNKDRVGTIAFKSTIDNAGIKEDTITEMSGSAPLVPSHQQKTYEDYSRTATDNYKKLQTSLETFDPLIKNILDLHERLLRLSQIPPEEERRFKESLAAVRRMIPGINKLVAGSKESALVAKEHTRDATAKAYWTEVAKYKVEDYDQFLIQHHIDSLQPAQQSAQRVPRIDKTQHAVVTPNDFDKSQTPHAPPPCSFKLQMLDFAARLLPLVYPPTRAPAWLARPAVARYAHPDRARTAGGSLELHALCARVAHIALLVHLGNQLEPLAAHRLVVEVPENSRLLLRALSPLPHHSLYAARAAPSREHKNSVSIRECLSRSSLAPLRACAAATVAAVLPKDDGGSDTKHDQSSQQYV
jgi:hypothetical protein